MVGTRFLISVALGLRTREHWVASGWMLSTYGAAGRRTNLTWPDNWFVDYEAGERGHVRRGVPTADANDDLWRRTLTAAHLVRASSPHFCHIRQQQVQGHRLKDTEHIHTAAQDGDVDPTFHLSPHDLDALRGRGDEKQSGARH